MSEAVEDWANTYVFPRPIERYPTDEDLRRLGMDLLRAFEALGVGPGGSVLIRPSPA